MNLRDNPILVTQARLARRAGGHITFVSAAVVGVVACWLYSIALAQRLVRGGNGALYELMELMAGVSIAQGFVAVAAGASVVAAIANDRRSGVFDANRLSPMRPQDVVLGYWAGRIGPAMALQLIGTAVVTVCALITPGSSMVHALTSQIAVLSSTLTLGWVAVWVAQEIPTPKYATATFIAVTISALVLLGVSEQLVTWHALGLAAAAEQFDLLVRPDSQYRYVTQLFGVAVPSTVVTLAVQAAIVGVSYVGAVRRATSPERRPFGPRAIVSVFAGLVLVQSALVWHEASGLPRHVSREPASLVFIFLFGAAALASFAAASSARDVRRAALGALRWDEAPSAVPVAAMTALLAAIPFVFMPDTDVSTLGLGVADLFATVVMVAASVEAARVSGSRRLGATLGAIGIAAFVLPILGGAWTYGDSAFGALIASGVSLIHDGVGSWSPTFEASVGAVTHILMAAGALAVWRRAMQDAHTRALTTTR